MCSAAAGRAQDRLQMAAVDEHERAPGAEHAGRLVAAAPGREVVGQPGDASTHLDNRVGEPAANPYLYMASQIAAGLDGVVTAADPGPSADAPYSADAPMLPKSLMMAIAALRDNTCFRAAFGEPFIDYFIKLKEFEIGRFLSDVTDWEQREYFEIL